MPKAHPLTAVVAVLAVASCGGDGAGPATVSSVEVTPASATLSAGGASQLFTARVLDAGGAALSGVDVTWASSRPGVATVGGDGRAVAVAGGATVITASAGGERGEALLTVELPDCADESTVALASDRMRVHEKTAWMLRALRTAA